MPLLKKRQIVYSKGDKPADEPEKFAPPLKKTKLNDGSSVPAPNPTSNAENPWYTALYCNVAKNKKHKTYDNGYLQLKGNRLLFYDEDKAHVSSVTVVPSKVENGYQVVTGGKEVIVQDPMSSDEIAEFHSKPKPTPTEDNTVNVPLKMPKRVPLSHYSTPKETTVVQRHDLKADSLVLYEPKTDKEVYVILDPIIQSKLRPHQLEGVKFIYDCLMGSKMQNQYGCVLADDM